MKYSREDIEQGLNRKQQASETPSNFGILAGASERPAGERFNKQRMAGESGARALAMMNDPNEAQRTDERRGRFGMSNQGMEFNQARMSMDNRQHQEEQE